MKIHMNLQLFAQPANHTGATGMSAEMKTYYEKRLLDQAEPLLVHDQFGDKYPIPANNGKTIEFRKYESLPKATEPLTEGVTPNAQALTVTPMTATVKQYGGWAAITDVLQLTAIDNNITQATKVLASQAGRTLDTVTREVLAGGTNVIYARGWRHRRDQPRQSDHRQCADARPHRPGGHCPESPECRRHRRELRGYRPPLCGL